MTALQIRIARREDVPAIVRLLAEDELGAARESTEEAVPQAYWDAFDRLAPDNAYYVAVVENLVAGCYQLTLIPGLSRRGMTRAQIEGVRVAAAHRGARIGAAMMQDAIARARAAGCGLVQLTTDRGRVYAHRFYERLGFEPSHIGMKLALERPPPGGDDRGATPSAPRDP